MTHVAAEEMGPALRPEFVLDEIDGVVVVAAVVDEVQQNRASTSPPGFPRVPTSGSATPTGRCLSMRWHGHSTERDFLYVTTQNLSLEQLQQLSEEVGSERTLLVLCSAFRGPADRFSNLTAKKIPKQVLSRCEWGHDDYSLKTENLPQALPKMGQQDLF